MCFRRLQRCIWLANPERKCISHHHSSIWKCRRGQMMPLSSVRCWLSRVLFILKLELNKSGFKLRVSFTCSSNNNYLIYRLHFLKIRNVTKLFLQPGAALLRPDIYHQQEISAGHWGPSSAWNLSMRKSSSLPGKFLHAFLCLEKWLNWGMSTFNWLHHTARLTFSLYLGIFFFQTHFLK